MKGKQVYLTSSELQFITSLLQAHSADEWEYDSDVKIINSVLLKMEESQ